MVNIFGKRTGCVLRCLYWHRQDTNSNKIIYNTNPDGAFYAKYVGSNNNQLNNISDFQTDSNEVTISTADSVDIRPNDRIMLRGTRYIVLDAQNIIVPKCCEFSSNPDTETTIRMRRA